MAIRDAPGSFPGAPTAGFATGHSLNTIDAVAAAIGTDQESGWTTGASIVSVVQSLPPLDYHAAVIAYEVSANLGFHSSANERCSGKLGKIVTALQFGAYPSNQNLTSLAIPQDASLTATLWDPAVDSLPPDDSTSPVSLLPVNVVNVLAQPAPIIQKVITVGVWFAPSLLTMKAGGFAIRALTMYDAVFKVIVDDGQ